MKFAFLIVFAILANIVADGQNGLVASPTTPSANASSIGVFGEVPVSYFTGKPNISVPIHTIHTPYVDVPISIDYNADGFRPDIRPSWVGMNWALNAGGAITRKVNGLPDEFNDNISNFGGGYASGQGYYYSHNYNNQPDWYVLSSTYPQSLTGWYDLEPDEFDFNFLNYSGKFYMDHLGNWKVQCDKPLTVSFTPGDFVMPFIQIGNGGHPHLAFNKFVITDDKGVKYTFGTASATEYSAGMAPPDYDLCRAALATSWFLTSIDFPVGPPVTFTYERGPYQSSLQYYQSMRACWTGDIGSSPLDRFGLNSNLGGQGISGTMISPVYLTSISYPKENLNIVFQTSKNNDLKYTVDNYLDVNRTQSGSYPTGSPVLVSGFPGTNMTSNIPYFTRNPSEATRTNADYNTSKYIWLKLDGIQISYSNEVIGDATTSLMRNKFSFTYLENATHRLQLTSVTNSGSDGTNPLLYSFKYDNTPQLNYLTEIGDHWGFSNGSRLIRNANSAYNAIGNLFSARQPVAGEALKGLLSEIDYPTGAKSFFYYENHQCSVTMTPVTVIGSSITMPHPQTASGSTLVGGARIAKIIHTDGLGGQKFQRFSYGEGVLENLPKYDWSYSVTLPNGSALVQSVETSAGIVPGSSVSAGRHVGYYNVTEYAMDGSYNKYTFSNHDWGYYMEMNPVYVYQVVNNAQVIGVIPCGNREFEKGRLLGVDSYNATGQLVAKKEYTYSRIGDDSSNHVRSFLIDGTLCTAGTAGNLKFSGLVAYYFLTYHFCNTDIKDHYYDANGHEFMKETVNTFDTHGYLTKSTTVASNGDNDETDITYPYNYASDPVLTAMTGKNMISSPVTTDKYVNGVYSEGTKNTYALFGPPSFPALSLTQYKSHTDPYQTRVSYNSYDANGNILELQKANDFPEAFVWGYGGRWLVADVKGATAATAGAQLNSTILNTPTSAAQLQTELQNLRTNLPGTLSTTYSYNSDGTLNMQRSMTGQATSYEYDNVGRLLDIKDNNGNYVKKFSYNYQQQPFNKNVFYSDPVTTEIYRGDCGPCGESSTVLYTTVPGKFSSTVSQDAANQAAIADATGPNETSYAIPAGAVCSPTTLSLRITAASNWDVLGSSVYPISSTINGLSFTVMPLTNYTSSAWHTYHVVGTIDPSPCFTVYPASLRTVTASESGRTWSITISTTGVVQIELATGTAPTSVYPISISTQFNL